MAKQTVRNLVIRVAQPEDADGLVYLLNEVGREMIYIANEGAWASAAQEREILRRRNPHQHLVLVAEVVGHLLGTLEIVRGGLMKNRHTASLAMAVAASHRGQGIGTALLRAGEVWARAEGIEKIGLSVFSTNTAARGLYQRFGYAWEGTRQGQFRWEATVMDEVLMAKWLT